MRLTPKITARGAEIDIVDHNTQSKCAGLMQIGRGASCVINGVMNDARDAGAAAPPTFSLKSTAKLSA